MERGYIQVYTGEGKGKTTAAFGLALRAIESGLTVLIVHFLKPKIDAGGRALARLGATVRAFATPGFVVGTPTREQRAAAEEGVRYVSSAWRSAPPDVAVLDEIHVALSLGLLCESDVLAILDTKPAGTEIVCTGRCAPQTLIERADLVTEMRLQKHYYDAGVAAREGIEY